MQRVHVKAHTGKIHHSHERDTAW